MTLKLVIMLCCAQSNINFDQPHMFVNDVIT